MSSVISEDLQSQIRELYSQGMGRRLISKKLGVSGTCVMNYCKKFGIRRLPSDAMAFVSNREHHPNADFFDVVDTQEKAYWLGFIIADGSVSKREHTLNLTTTKDGAHLEKFARIFDVPVKFKNTNPSYFVEIYSTRIVRAVIRLGVKPNKTVNEDGCVFDHVPVNLRSHFLRGVLDGDGCLRITKKGQLKIYWSGHIRVVGKIRSILVGCLGVHPVAFGFQGDFYSSVVWHGNRVVKRICDYIYQDANVFLSRKFLVYKGVL